ncbi:MAG: DUF3039 domain-containing protein [Actinomycetaceae bacterium]|nr:DUF3039 domain-containing protein [Actinomycetaceae bacterium]
MSEGIFYHDSFFESHVSHNVAYPNAVNSAQAQEPGTSAGTGVLERTETKKKKIPGDNERYAHYVRKDRVTESAVTGRPVVALCGKIWVPKGDPKGVPVCPKCKEIAARMRSQGPNWPFGSPQ